MREANNSYFDAFPEEIIYLLVPLALVLNGIVRISGLHQIMFALYAFAVIIFFHFMITIKKHEVLPFLSLAILNSLDIITTVLSNRFEIDPKLIMKNESNVFLTWLVIPGFEELSLVGIVLFKCIIFWSLYRSWKIGNRYSNMTIPIFEYSTLFSYFKKSIYKLNRKVETNVIGLLLFLFGRKKTFEKPPKYEEKYIAYSVISAKTAAALFLLLVVVIANNVIQVFVVLPILNIFMFYFFYGSLVLVAIFGNRIFHWTTCRKLGKDSISIL